MADLGENLCSPDLKEEETVLALRLAEALRADEVETFLEIYDSIPCTTDRKRVSFQKLFRLPCKQPEIFHLYF